MRGGLLAVVMALAALAASTATGAPTTSRGACRLLFADDLRTAFHDPGSIYGHPEKAQPIRQIPGERRFRGTEFDCSFYGSDSSEQLWLRLSVLPTRAEAARYYARSTGRFCAKRDRLSFGPVGCRVDGTAGHLAASSGRFFAQLTGDSHDGSAMSIQTLEQLAKDVFEDAPRYY